MEIIQIGNEPQNIKKRMDTLFAKLDGAYPDKIIKGLQRDHKKWDETARDISKLLGYENKNAFLAAYGYTIERGGTGRPRTTNHREVIDELKKRYPDGSDFTKLGDLVDANPDLKSKLKTLSNGASELFGMSMKDYFVTIGLISKALQEKNPTKEELKEKEAFELRKKQEEYEKELELWDQKCKEICEQRQKLATERILEQRKEAELPFQRAFDAEIQSANRQRTNAELKKAEIEKQLEKLGVFDFMKKKALKKELEKQEGEIITAENRIKAAKQTLKTALAAVAQGLSQKEDEIHAMVEEELPIPEMPEKPTDIQ